MTALSKDDHEQPSDQLTGQMTDQMTLKIVSFIEALRGAGFQVGMRETRDALALAASPAIDNRSLFQLSLKSLLCSSQHQWVRFDRHFIQFFAPFSDQPVDDENPRQGWQHKNASEMNFQIVADFYHGEDEVDEGGAGRNGAVTNTDFRFLTDQRQWQEAARLAERLARQIRHRPSRRWRRATHGKRIDLAGTRRLILATDGDPLKLAKKNRKHRPLQIVALLDVSHSMSYYSPMLARFVRGLLHNFDNSEAFTFHIDLNRITDLLLETDMQQMRKKLEEVEDLWFGGTNISASLTSFNQHYLDDVANRNTVVLLISDGCDVSLEDEIVAPVRELRQKVRKVFWINPIEARLQRAGLKSSSPLMHASAYIDEIVSGDSLHSLERLARLLG